MRRRSFLGWVLGVGVGRLMPLDVPLVGPVVAVPPRSQIVRLPIYTPDGWIRYHDFTPEELMRVRESLRIMGSSWLGGVGIEL